MANIIIFHGTGCTPDHYWYPYLKSKLEDQGHTVWVPQLPNPDESNLSDWLPYALENGTYNEDTILIGHSAGSPLILSVLENINAKVKQAILVAGFIDLESTILQDNYDSEKIKSNVQDIIYINSDNDPWKCDDVQGKKMLEQFGGTQIIVKGDGHFGSTSFDQPYKEFPLLLKLIN